MSSMRSLRALLLLLVAHQHLLAADACSLQHNNAADMVWNVFLRK
jgi:hypothetical protein